MKYNDDLYYDKTNGKSFILLVLMTAAGIAAGALYTAKHNGTDSILLHHCFFHSGSEEGISSLFSESLKGSLLFLAAFFLSGTSAVGQPLISALIVYIGWGTGAAAAMMYSSHGTSAIFSIAALVPAVSAFLTVSLIAAREAMRSSCRLSHIMFGRHCTAEYSFGLYSVRFIVLAVISAIIAAADAAVCHAVLMRQ